MTVVTTARSIMNSPVKLAAAGAIVGVALGQFNSLTSPGPTGTPTVAGSISSMVRGTASSAIFSGLFGAVMAGVNHGNVAQGAKNGAIFGAILGASLTGGQLASAGLASTVGY
jgi:hypothetical protein